MSVAVPFFRNSLEIHWNSVEISSTRPRGRWLYEVAPPQFDLSVIMATTVILDCDWFTIDKTKHLKKLAFVCHSLNFFKEVTFCLPSTAHSCAAQLNREAHHSHGLVWSTRGIYGNHQVPQAFADLFEKLEQRPSQITFLAKGREKCVLLQKWLPTVENLEDSSCPKFEDLTNLEKTTLNKATIFALWYESWIHRSESPIL